MCVSACSFSLSFARNSTEGSECPTDAAPTTHPLQGAYTLDGEPHKAARMSMIAGGTGITPMYQVRLGGCVIGW